MFEKFLSTISAISIGLGSFLGITPEPVQAPVPAPIEEPIVGNFSPAAGGTYRLQTSIGTSDTTVTLSSFTEPITGAPITMSTLATDIAYATIDPQSTTRKEFISFTGVTQNADGTATLTGVTRGLSFFSPFTASSTLRKAHPGQSILILSDSPQFFNEYARRRANETITGQWTFATFPITPSTTLASTTAAGWVELATPQEAASGTATGTIGRLVIPASMATSSPSTSSGHVVPITGTNGRLSLNFFSPLLGLASSTVFTTTGTSTWTKNPDARYVMVEVQGPGGTGSAGVDNGADGTPGGGGGGGGYGREFFLASELGSTVSVFVATVGATSSFGTECFASSGSNGGGGVGGNGGSASGCDVNLQGDDGGLAADGTAAGSTGGGHGGDSFLGGGGRAGRGAGGNADGGSLYGGGGGGGGASDSGTMGTGGVGAQGIVIVTEYF